MDIVIVISLKYYTKLTYGRICYALQPTWNCPSCGACSLAVALVVAYLFLALIKTPGNHYSNQAVNITLKAYSTQDNYTFDEAGDAASTSSYPS